MSNKKVVIVGGGFVGSIVAKSLESKFRTTLIDKKDYFEFYPGVLRLVQDSEYIENITVKHKDYLKKTKILVGEVKEINDKYVLCDKNKIPFDYLVIATGSNYGFNLPIKNIIKVTDSQSLIKNKERIEKANDLAIIGGGLVGVELAAEICERFPDKKICIIHSREKLMERNDKKSSNYAETFLSQKGISIIKNERAVEQKEKFIITDKGTKIKADVCFMCSGISPNTGFMVKNMSQNLNEKGQIKVNDFLQLENHRNIFAGGDPTNLNEEKTAQAAEKQGKLIVNNILAIENNSDLKKYSPKKRPMIISLGKYNGIIEKDTNVIKGLLPAFIKAVVEKKSMLKRK